MEKYSELCYNVQEKHAELSKLITKLRRLIVMEVLGMLALYATPIAILILVLGVALLNQSIRVLYSGFYMFFAVMPAMLILVSIQASSSNELSYRNVKIIYMVYRDLVKTRRVYKAILSRCSHEIVD